MHFALLAECPDLADDLSGGMLSPALAGRNPGCNRYRNHWN